MNTAMQQMNKTAAQMAASLKKLPRQGAFGVAALIGAELLAGGD
jgi:hypothetical protein